MDENVKAPTLVGEVMGVKIYANAALERDEVVIGYPDGKGGLKPGFVTTRSPKAPPTS